MFAILFSVGVVRITELPIEDFTEQLFLASHLRPCFGLYHYTVYKCTMYLIQPNPVSPFLKIVN